MALRTACGQRSCIKAFDGFLLRFARSCKQKRTACGQRSCIKAFDGFLLRFARSCKQKRCLQINDVAEVFDKLENRL
ncbi:hypothetical protein [Campylobacter geochelonis]|uniref:hypothetical protein n=1 Tax=Campylobacter geochelonis TaxID=1780362 RepID=UPI00155D9A68|nr:hypothetical protein [Campylobacter geochelonis]